MGKIKVLFMYWSPSTFIQRDLNILRKHFEVRVLGRANIKSPIFWLKAFIGILWADVTFSWFANPPALVTVLLSKIFKKRSIVVVGGYEVAKELEIDYGGMLRWWSASMVKFILENANRVLTVDDGLKKDAIRNAGVSGENIQTVPMGYDHRKFKLIRKKKELVITVATGKEWGRVRLKGIDTFVHAAKHLPNVKFLVVGIEGYAQEKLESMSPLNVKFVKWTPQDELVKYYQEAKVYCQLSKREGLPNALCEAMLCGCVPVGTDVQGVRTAIGETGFYVPYGDSEAAARVIKKALRSDKGKVARERINNNFPIERRERELVHMIGELIRW